MTYEITVEHCFWAGHAIVLPDGSLEPEHFHNWRATIRVGCTELDGISTVMDFHVLEAILGEITTEWTGRMLNDCAPFMNEKGELAVNPTAERIAAEISSRLQAALPEPERLYVLEVSLEESYGCRAIARPIR